MAVPATVFYRYDGMSPRRGRGFLGRLTEVSVVRGTAFRFDQFDRAGRVLKNSQAMADGRSFPFSYTYNLAGGLEKMTYPSGLTVKNCYDGAGRPLSLLNGETGTDYYAQVASGADPESPSETIAGYNPFGGMQRLLLQGGAMVQSARYNERGQMTRIGLHKTPATGTASRLLRLGLDYSPIGGNNENNGNIRTMTVAAGQAAGNTNPLFSATQTYEYDAVNRLKSAAEGTAWKQTFGYDRFGNRWIEAGPSTCTAGANTCGIDSRGAATGRASYVGSTNRLSGVPHDCAGNASPAGLTLTYDVENRVVKMVTNGAESLYEYDGEGRRVMKVSGGVTTTYVYDAAGQLAAEYATGGSEVGETGRRYLFADHLGSTRLRTTQDGTVVGWWDYAPFGEEVPGTAGGRSGVSGMGYGGTYAKVRFGGKERDVEGATSASLGLDYFEARYLGVGLGRFTSPDKPFADQDTENPQSWNLYAYARATPLVLVDPNGEAVHGSWAAAKAAVWKRELDSVTKTGQGYTRIWDPTELAELKATGKVSGYDIHHTNSKGHHAHLALEEKNLRPLKKLGPTGRIVGSTTVRLFLE